MPTQSGEPVFVTSKSCVFPPNAVISVRTVRFKARLCPIFGAADVFEPRKYIKRHEFVDVFRAVLYVFVVSFFPLTRAMPILMTFSAISAASSVIAISSSVIAISSSLIAVSSSLITISSSLIAVSSCLITISLSLIAVSASIISAAALLIRVSSAYI